MESDLKPTGRLFSFLLHERSYLAKVYCEDEGGVGFDALVAALTVSEFGGNIEFNLSAFTHLLDSFGPTGNYAVEGEAYGIAVGGNLVEHIAVEGLALVAHPYGILGAGRLYATFLDNLVLEAAGELHDTFLGLVLGKELLFSFFIGEKLEGTPVLEEFAEETVHFLGVDLELLTEVGVTHVALGVDEIVHTLLDLAVVQVTEIVVLDEGTEVDSHEVRNGIELSLAGLEILGGLDNLFYGLDGFFAIFHACLLSLGRAGGHCKSCCEDCEQKILSHCFINS